MNTPEQQYRDGLLFEHVQREPEVMHMPKEEKTIMTVGRLKGLLAYFNAQDDFEVWLSSDEEGNDFLPMLANPKWSLAVEEEEKRVTLFPSHR